jgi:hypothetical protein
MCLAEVKTQNLRFWFLIVKTLPPFNLLFLYVELIRTMSKASYQAAIRLTNASNVALDSIVVAAANATANGYVTQNEITLMTTSLDASLTKLRAAHKLLSEINVQTSIPLCGNCSKR